MSQVPDPAAMAPSSSASEPFPNSQQSSSTCRTTQPARWDLAVLSVFLLACLVLMLPGGADPDLWGHIQFGRDVFREGIPSTTTYSYTAEEYPWINHENLSELWFATVDDAAGGLGLQLTRLVLAAIVLGLGLLVWHQYQVELVPTAVWFTLLVANLKYHWSIRPQLFTYTLFFLMLAWCDLTFRGWSHQWRLPWFRSWARATGDSSALNPTTLTRLWLIVPLLLVWVNTHGGFAAGLAVVVTYFAMRGIELLLSRGPASKPWLQRLGLIAFALVLVAFINPYGYRLPLWLSNIGIARPEITEWHGLAFGESFTWLFLALLGLTAATLYYSRRPLDATHLCIGLLVAAQAVAHRRHIAFFVLLLILWMPGHVADVWAQLKQRYASAMARSASQDRRFGWAAWALAAALAAWLVYRASDIRVPRSQYPVGAMEYITAHRLGGNIVVAFNWAQYALAGLADEQRDAPPTRVAFDGRFTTCYPESVLDTHFDFILGMVPGKRGRSPDSPPFDPERALRDGEPNLVLIDRKQGHSCRVMREQGSEWTLLYQDAISEVWGRSDFYDDPSRGEYIPPANRITSDTRTNPLDGTVGSTPWPALPYQYLNRRRHDAYRAPSQVADGADQRSPITRPVTTTTSDVSADSAEATDPVGSNTGSQGVEAPGDAS